MQQQATVALQVIECILLESGKRVGVCPFEGMLLLKLKV